MTQEQLIDFIRFMEEDKGISVDTTEVLLHELYLQKIPLDMTLVDETIEDIIRLKDILRETAA